MPSRIDAVLAAVACGATSLGGMLPHLFPAGPDGHQIIFAMGEAILLLNYLWWRGQLERTEVAGLTRFSPTSESQ